MIDAYGFLAVFAAAVALQWTVAGEGRQEKGEAGEPHPAIAPLQQFNSDLESLFEFAVVIVVGALFAIVAIPLETLAVAAVLFLRRPTALGADRARRRAARARAARARVLVRHPRRRLVVLHLLRDSPTDGRGRRRNARWASCWAWWRHRFSFTASRSRRS